MTADVQRLLAVIRDAVSADDHVTSSDPLKGDPAVLCIQMSTGHTYYVEVTE